MLTATPVMCLAGVLRFVQAGVEFCDEGAANFVTDGFGSFGDGVQNGTEACDDGNDDNTLEYL